MSDCLRRISDHGNAAVTRLNLLDSLAENIDNEPRRIAIQNQLAELRTELSGFASTLVEYLNGKD